MARIVLAASTGKGRWSKHARMLRDYATYRYAQEFHQTAKKTGSMVVRAYLLGHAIELYLKSFLLRAGFDSALLKKKRYGHHLGILLAEAKNHEIERLIRVSPEMVEDLKKLDVVYPETLRYFSMIHLLTQPSIPPLARLFRLANGLSKGLEKCLEVAP